MSKQYENDIAAEIFERTSEDVRVYRCGFSGNAERPEPDVAITTPTNVHAIELKKRQGPTAYIESDDLEQLAECQNGYTIAYLVVKFPHYEPVVVRYWPHMVGHDDWNERSVVEKFKGASPSALDPRVTDGGNLALTLDKDRWVSTKAGRDDVETILDEIKVAYQDVTVVEDAQPNSPYVQSA